jgi:phosphopantothenoylcysteine decarboxylase / phosphopantothenate---cysteine ligase
MDLQPPKVLLIVTGSIAAYKAPDIVRKFKQAGYLVKVVVTSFAQKFVTIDSLQAVAQQQIYTDLESGIEAMSHIELARWPDYILIAPATANCIAKLSVGVADDLLTTLCLVTHAQIILVPAMNHAMWCNPITQENVKRLQDKNFLFLGPDQGEHACGELGLGRMLEPQVIVDELTSLSTKECYLNNLRVLITAGPTRERIDSVRYLSNFSSGKMGYHLAQVAQHLGAHVTLISGPVALTRPQVNHFITVESAHAMLQAVHEEISNHDIFISAAAISDYTCAHPAKQKIKKSNVPITLELIPTTDIFESLKQLKKRPFLVGFAAETENIIANAQEKRLRKGADLMIVNDVSNPEIGFDSEENEVTVLSEQGVTSLTRAHKKIIATQLLHLIYQHFATKGTKAGS